MRRHLRTLSVLIGITISLLLLAAVGVSIRFVFALLHGLQQASL